MQAHAQTQEAVAYFSGGCYWCMESEFQTREGVMEVISGFAVPLQSDLEPVETVEVRYDPVRLSFEDLLAIYWRNVDPFDAGGQFYDRGHKYTTAIYYQTETERSAAQKSFDTITARMGRAPLTRIEPFGHFTPVATPHQDFFLKNPDHYEGYVKGSGRKEKLKKLWE